MPTAAEYREQLKQLLPPGQAFPRDPGTTLHDLLDGMSIELARIDARGRALPLEANPGSSNELLPDWERVAGLPDRCSGVLEETIQGRRNALLTKLSSTGGQSIPYFISVAAALGYQVTITEFLPFRVGRSVVGDALTNGDWAFAWQVNAPETTVVTFRVGLSAVGEPLRTWGTGSLECKIRQLAPAHTIPIFTYANSSLDLLFDVGAYLLNQQSSSFGVLITFTRSTAAGRWNALGEYEMIGINQPRFDYDPVTHAPLGLLIEESRTNIYSFSQAFSNAAWSKGLATITTPAGSSPIGTVHKFIESTSAGPHFLQRSNNAIAGATYSAFRVLKAEERSIVRAQFYSSFAHAQADFNLETGIASGNGKMTNIGDGWYICEINGTISTSVSVADRWYPLDESGSTSYVGDGVSGYLVSASQLEQATFSTSYIPTTTVSAARAADVASMDSLSNWYKQGEGTLYVEASSFSSSTGTGKQFVLLGATAADRIGLGLNAINQTNGSAVANSAVQCDFKGGAVAPRSVCKQALCWGLGSASYTSQGDEPLQDATVTAPLLTSMRIGSYVANANFTNGYIRKIRYFPRRLSEADLQALTLS
ncbi:putative phage tail protein [Pseudomonas sp. HY13-MNA-CIBAN-0226]|uniref:YmfQ family protein n=1 Tax=Pseudomonas sp. HY13-MNA-CIBAN-0226 TaxID=3140473 RepID=UPI00331EFEF4